MYSYEVWMYLQTLFINSVTLPFNKMYFIPAKSPSMAGSECCYDKDDNLVYAQDSIYGSFSNRISRFSGALPVLSSAATDFVPYLFCNVIDSNDDHYYQLARPTRDCKDYEPVQPCRLQNFCLKLS